MINPDRDQTEYTGMVPGQGDLRFVEREVDNHGTPALARILQRWEWSYTLGEWGWFDVPLVKINERDTPDEERLQT